MVSLDKVPERHLRAVLDALCKEASVETKVKNMLEQLQRVEKMLSPEDSRGSKTAGVKRKPDELVQICIHCDEAFCDETNSPTACTSHESDGKSKLVGSPRLCIREAHLWKHQCDHVLTSC